MNKYKYRVSTTGHSSVKFGNCQVCGEHVSEVFYQTEKKLFLSLPTGKRFYTSHGCTPLFGHRDCLISKQVQV